MHVYFPEKYHFPMLYCRVVMEIGVATKVTSTTLFSVTFMRIDGMIRIITETYLSFPSAGPPGRTSDTTMEGFPSP